MPIMTTRRRVLALAAAAVAGPAIAQTSPALTAEDQALVARATAYLQDLASAEARFSQADARGQVTVGSLYLQRPGKARFAYDPPSGLLVVSDGAVVSVQDTRLKTFDRYPLGMTPLSLFLAKTIRLDRGVQVTRVTRTPGGFQIIARDGAKKTAGQLALGFTETPLALTGWTVTDAQGRSTQVRLSGLRRSIGLDPSLFVLKDPRPTNTGRARM